VTIKAYLMEFGILLWQGKSQKKRCRRI